MDDLDKELGIDKALTDSLAREPQGEITDMVRTPHPKPGGSFEFVTLYWVTPDGRVDDCRLLKASGDKSFDESFCATLKNKGRFKPAVNRAGQAVRAPRFENVVIRTQVFKVQWP